jgi:glycosidase
MKTTIFTFLMVLCTITLSAQSIKLLTEPLENRKSNIVVYGQVTGVSKPANISLQINNDIYTVALNDTGLFMLAYTLKEGNNVVKTALTETGLTTSSNEQTLTYIVDKNPTVTIESIISSSTVQLSAIGSSPVSSALTYAWEQKTTNPEILNFSAASGQNISFAMPSKKGEYFFYCTATDAEGRSFKAGRFLKIGDNNKVFNNENMHAAWVDSIVIYEYPFFRIFEKPLQTMAKKFRDIKNLGATAIWHSPVFQTDGGGYHVKDYYHIGSQLGVNEDYKEFVNQAHKAGLKVIFDIPVGHTNKKHPFLNNARALKNNSPYKDYYYWSGAPGNSQVTVDPDNGAECVQTNLNNTETYEYFQKVLEYWVSEYKIDGIRYDVGQNIYKRAPEFLIEAQKRLRNINPDIALFIEGNYAENPNYLSVADICYDWELYDWGNSGLKGIFNQQITIEEFHTDFMQSFADSTLPLRYMNTGYFEPANTIWDKEREKTGTMIAFTGFGTPQMYVGTETGSSTNKYDQVNWTEDLSVYPYYRKLAIVKKYYLGSYPKLTRLTNTNPTKVYSYLSKNNDNRIIVVANLSNAAQTTTVNLNIPGINTLSKFTLQDLISGEKRVLSASELSSASVSLKAWQSKLFWIGVDTINISRVVSSINIGTTDNKNAISESQGLLQMYAQTAPDDALNQKISWSVNNTNAATISNDGLLKATGLENTSIKIYAKTTDGSNIIDSITISIANQLGYVNLIQNPQFNTGQTNWSSNISAPANATIQLTDGVLSIAIVTKSTNSWGIQYMQNGLPLVKGELYRLSFDAKASISQNGQVAIGKSVSPYDSYFSQQYAVTSSWKNYSYDFTMSSTSDNNARLYFDLGLNDGTFSFDNFVLRKVIGFNISATANIANAGTLTGTGKYEDGKTVSLTATPKTGYTFSNWTENGTQVSTTATYSFNINANRTLVANFNINSYSITASVLPANSGTITGIGNFNYGTNISLTATPATGYKFSNWTENGTQVSTNAIYTFAVNANRTLVANYTVITIVEALFENSINIYPNPVSSELIIEIAGNRENVNYELINVAGKLVYKGNLVEKTTVQTSNFVPGVYLIKFENGKVLKFKKIIKK